MCISVVWIISIESQLEQVVEQIELNPIQVRSTFHHPLDNKAWVKFVENIA